MRRILGRLVLPLGAVAVVGILAGLWYSDRLAGIFEAREQEVASSLLSRPFHLRPGVLTTPEDLARRLERLGYRRVKRSVTEEGTYTAWGGGVQAYLRAGRDERGDHPARVVRVRSREGRIESVDRDDAFLEPETLTLFHGPEMEERELVELTDCPKHLLDAILAAEDRRFFTHPGVDPVGILRALWANATSGSFTQGGSTVTQQLAKNLYFSGERSYTRKTKEAFAAMVLEARYTKERLLRAYLNEIYLGQRGPASIRGVGRAARHYFGKYVGDLTLGESALLAGMIQAPGRYNPFLYKEAALARRKLVLNAMIEMGAISEEDRKAAAAEPLSLRPASERGRGAAAAYVIDTVRQELIGKYGSDFWQRGIRVRTSIDPVYQEAAEDAVASGLAQLSKEFRSVRKGRDGASLQAALITLDLRDGAVLALVGGRDFSASQFNRATSARRQPGSLFKPVVYLAGLAHPGDGEEPGWLDRWRQRWSGGEDVVLMPLGDREGQEDLVVPARRKGGVRSPIAEGKKRHWWSWDDPDESTDESTDPNQIDEERTVEEAPHLPLSAATILLDEPYEIESGGKTWSPQNYDREFRGPVTVQRALEESLNVPTARAAAAIGFGRVARTARALGIHSTMPELPSLALGTAEVTPMEMATAFSTIANEGRRRQPWVIERIEGEDGGAQALRSEWPYPTGGAEAPPVEAPAAGRGSGRGIPRKGEAETDGDLVPARATWIMTGLLEGVMIHGTGRTAAQLGFYGTAAGKTGTSDGGRDLWFCGYTPDLLTLVWVGFDDGTPTHLSGAHAALPIWAEYMKKIGAGTSRPFDADARLLWAPIDPTTGMLAGRRCPETRWAPFIPGTEPVMRCTQHESFWDRWRE